MASAELPSVESIHDTILKDGFYFSKDPALGQQVARMNEDYTPFASASGLQFCVDNVVSNPSIRPILDSFLKWFGLGLYRSFGTRPGDYMFKSSDPEAEVDCLVVHLLSKNSQMVFWGGSHRQSLHSIPGENNLWLVPRAVLNRLGRSPTTITFEQGGFAIIDPRIAVQIVQGHTITFAFATKEVLNGWSLMDIHKSKDTEHMVRIMENLNCGVNCWGRT